MMLVAPVVQQPLTPWSRSVRVCGQLTGATVSVYTIEAGGKTTAVGQAVAGGPDFLVPLNLGIELKTGQRIIARQQLRGQTSPVTPIASAITVLAKPGKAHLDSLFSRAVPAQCGTCLWLEGVIPGAQVEVSVAGASPISQTAERTGIHVDVPALPAQGMVLGGVATVTCRQVHGTDTGSWITLPPAQALPAGELAAPRVKGLLYACQKIVTFTNVVPGAELTVDHGDDSYQFCFGAPSGSLHLNRALKHGDKLRFWQSLGECEIGGQTGYASAFEHAAPTPQWPYPVCRSDREVVADGLLPGARVQFLLGKGTGRVVTGMVAEGQRRFVLPPFGNDLQLGVRQTLCDDSETLSWSQTAWVTLGDPGSPDHPAIQEPVTACAIAVGVVRLSAGTKVRVMSSLWAGPIGEAVATGDEYTMVPLFFAATDGDRLSLQLLRCGLQRDIDGYVTVRPAPRDLKPPRLEDPSDDAGGSVTVYGLEPGAICDIEVVDPSDRKRGTVIASQPVVLRDAAVPVPSLELGWLIRCRQRLCATTSGWSQIVRVADLIPPYVVGSAHRIVALTGNRAPAGKNPRYDTTDIGLHGTDLGIPVVHKGRLFFFFGDAEHGMAFEGKYPQLYDVIDMDPIAWTTDGPQTPGGPWLNFLTTPEGFFRPLEVLRLPPFGNFCVPTGGFSYQGKLWLFVADNKNPADGPGQRMNDSHLAVTHEYADVEDGFESVADISSTDKPGWPQGRFLTHVSPTVVKCADWPGLPVKTGDGLIVFGTGLYQKSPIYLAFTPLPFRSWYFLLKADPGKAPEWVAAKDMWPPGPLEMIPGNYGELSVSWIPQLRRWLAIHQGNGIVVRTARNPWGPWTAETVVFNGADPVLQAAADNLEPGHQFVGLKRPDENRLSAAYSPYLIPSWTRYDTSTRLLTIYYTMSVEGPVYNVQLMSAQLRYPR